MDDVEHNLIAAFWRQGLDTLAIANSMGLRECDVEREINRMLDRQERGKTHAAPLDG